MKYDVSIIIISYNTKDMTVACIKSVIDETTQLNYDIIVFDNNSADGSAKAIAEKFPQIKLVSYKENLGFAAGNNLAATKAHGKFILLLNPDTIVLNRAINKLYNFAQTRTDALIWGGELYSKTKRLILLHVGDK